MIVVRAVILRFKVVTTVEELADVSAPGSFDDEFATWVVRSIVSSVDDKIVKKKKVREGSYWVFNTFSDVYIKHVFGDYLTYQNKQGKTVYAKWGSAESHAVYNKDNVVLDMMTGLKYVFRNMAEKNRMMYDFDCKATLVYNKEA